ncbi:MAG: NAD-dependent DNA ligase LigA, partial [Puniceicoccales bacterium]|nr:NAD-dependent DNA ligase LigA [Puniceicoccales bacterium]
MPAAENTPATVATDFFSALLDGGADVGADVGVADAAVADATARVAALRREIARHNRLYYQEATPEITDFEYDRLARELEDVLAQNPALADAAPETQTPGDDSAEGFAKAAHDAPMLSIANTYNRAEFFNFAASLRRLLPPEAPLKLVVEPKIDGVAVSLLYENGRFVRALTRGNGVVGDDITRNIATLAALPHELTAPAPRRIELRGEIYMRNAEFARINAARETAGLPLYANPRNLAAGTVKLLDPAETAERKLEVVLYGFGGCDPADCFATLGEFRDALRRWGLPSVEFFERADSAEVAWEAIRQLETLRRGFAYPTDGAVVKLDSVRDQAHVGANNKCPRWVIAYKFAPEQAQTRLRAITLQVGRTGAITPVAELDPVEISGSTVSRATLHNEDEVARKDLREGDTVVVEKAGEIIPQVVCVVPEKRNAASVPFDFAARLAELGLDAARAEGEAVWRLKTPSREQRLRGLSHFASKQCLDIENLGPAAAAALLDAGFVNGPADFYKLRREDLVLLENFADKSADNLVSALEASKRRELWRVIHALGIPNVGMRTAKDLAQHFKTLDALAAAGYSDYRKRVVGTSGRELTAEESVVTGVGAVIAQSLIAWFSAPEHREFVEALRSAGLNFSGGRVGVNAGVGVGAGGAAGGVAGAGGAGEEV